MDNDALMLQEMGTALTTLQIKYRSSPLADRMELRPQLEQLTKKYTDYQLLLIEEGILSTDDDLAEMANLKGEIDAAAEKQHLVAAIAKTIVFIAQRIT